MTQKEHREHHKMLRIQTDQLIHCFLETTRRKVSETTVMEFKRWLDDSCETANELDDVKSIIIHGK